jgi:hypothetical protein
MAYIGSTPTTQSFISGTDYFNGTGSQTSFTLSRPVGSVNDIQAVVNNVVQVPNDAYNVSGTSIVFTSAPSSGTGNVYVRYMSTTTQSITPSQNTVSYATWDNDLRNETFAFKNRIINGAMVIDQRNAGASVSTTPTDAIYTLDRWMAAFSTATRYTVQQDAGAVTPPTGFTDYLGVTSTATTSVGSSDYYFLQQIIEGFNVADLGWGTANAQTVTLSFWVRSSLTGTFGGALSNGAQNRSYPFSYSIAAANTWEYKTVTVVGDTTGTWITNNGAGLRLRLGLGVGSTLSGTAGAWAGSNFASSTGATSVVGTNGATFYVTGVQLEKGSTATSFDYRPYTTELQLCQRYFQRFGNGPTGVSQSSSTFFCSIVFPVQMRAAPSAVVVGLMRISDITTSAYTQTSGSVSNNIVSSEGGSFELNNFSPSMTTGRFAIFAQASSGTLQLSAEL